MKRWMVWSLIPMLTTACGGAPTTTRSGRDMAVELLEVGIGQARPDAIRPLISDDYRQHNPRVPDGPAGLLDFVTEFSRLPESQRTRVQVLRSFQDGSFVVTHSEYLRQGNRIAGFDVFRVRDGRLVEHWDLGMRERAPNPSGHGLLDGGRPDEASLGAGTEATRALVTGLVERGLVDRDPTAMEQVLAESCIQHDPGVADGARPWIEAVSNGDLVHEELFRVIAQGQWALTQSRGRRGERPAVIYDLFRLEDERVAEHWVVWGVVPERMAHSNGML